jgi:hypothetical protein
MEVPMSENDSIANVLLGGLPTEERSSVLARLREAAEDERAAAEAGHPRPFPGPGRSQRRAPMDDVGPGALRSDAELDRAAAAPWRGPT